ncbi:VOC family protein [Roseobacter weihaiensis]|uniref:VOC family protein n=1 Tax=Roseobacter weihaiensis TaxID=2763262 RepID=UPI001D0AA7A5|nr:VOC family protein [Roseobacter sp. H9]
MTALLEHANVTVSNANRTAQWMSELFGWHIRWQGPAIDGGRSLHIGTDSQYLALYQPARTVAAKSSTYHTAGGLNHIAIVVDDIDALEKQVTAAGFTAVNHADYEPGRRFYFHDHDDIEYEVVQYD